MLKIIHIHYSPHVIWLKSQYIHRGIKFSGKNWVEKGYAPHQGLLFKLEWALLGCRERVNGERYKLSDLKGVEICASLYNHSRGLSLTNHHWCHGDQGHLESQIRHWCKLGLWMHTNRTVGRHRVQWWIMSIQMYFISFLRLSWAPAGWRSKRSSW